MSKRIKILTLKYDYYLEGFPHEPLQKIQAEGNVMECREYFFQIGDIPHMTFVLEMDGFDTDKRSQNHIKPKSDPWRSLPENRKPLYKVLKEWRNNTATDKGVPFFAILRNQQLADICLHLPKSLSALKEIQGIGEATVKNYGEDILKLIPDELAKEPEKSIQKEETEYSEKSSDDSDSE